MEIIKNLVQNKYSLFNVGYDKIPVDKHGNKLIKWNNLSYDELKQSHNYNSLLWGMKMGLHENNEYILSLDFDCCGVKNSNGDRIGCIPTSQKLKNMLDNIDILDGFYLSSTKGNANILINYTNCNELIEIITKIGSNKINYDGLEILLGGNQVIPPSKTKCKITNQFDTSRHFQTNNPFYKLNENSFMYEFVRELLINKLPKINVSIKNVAIKNNESSPEYTPKTDKYIDLLFNVIKNENINWNIWFQIAGILKYNGYDKQIFINYSNLQEINNKANQMWDTIKINTPMSIYGLQTIAKKINPYGYKEWLINYKEYLPLSILNKGENDVAKYIASQLKGTIIYSNDWFICDNNLWRTTKAPHSKIINHIQYLIDISKETLLFYKSSNTDNSDIKKKCEDQEKEYNSHYVSVNRNGFSSQIIKYLQEYLYIKDFYNMLDNHIYKIAYKNGILDLTTLIFRNGIYAEDYLSSTLNFDYEIPNQTEIDWVNFELKKICNFNDSHLAYYKSVLGYALTGDSSKIQEFFYLCGQTASNGKSTILEALQEILPLYVDKAPSNALDENNTKLHKVIGTWKNKRILWTNELSEKKKDPNLIKCIGDGTSLSYEKLYDTNKIMNILFKLFMVSNFTLDIKMDNGIKRRLRHMQMDSEFIDTNENNFDKKIFIKDKTFLNKITTQYKHALLHVLFLESKRFFETNTLCDFPIEWKIETENVVNTNDTFKDFWEDHFEVGKDFYCYKDEFKEIIDSYDGKIKIKDELKRLKIDVVYDKTKMINKQRGFWLGIKSRE